MTVDLCTSHLLWTLKWLWSPIFERHGRWHLGQMNCPGSDGTAAAAFLLSRASVMLSRRFSSRLFCALFIRARQPTLSCALDSSCFWGMPASVALTLTQSLYRLRGLPWFRLPVMSSPYSSCFGNLVSCIRITCPVHRSWAFKIMASMLVVSALSKTFKLVIRSCQRMPRIDLRQRMWNCSNCFRCLLYRVHVSHPYRRLVRTMALYTFSFVDWRMLCSRLADSGVDLLV